MKIGIYECLRCHEDFESETTDKGCRCPFCGFMGELQRIEIRNEDRDKDID